MTPSRSDIARERARQRQLDRDLIRALHGDPAPPLEGMRFDGWQGHLDRADWLWRQGRPLDAWSLWTECRQEGSTDGRP